MDERGQARDRRALVGQLIAAQADGAVGTVPSLERLCRAAKKHLEVSGVAVSLMSETGSLGVVAGAEEHSVRVDELQFTSGEGPSHDAFELHRPVLASDLQSYEGERWPGYRAMAQDAGMRAVFAFPLQVGAAAFGVLTVYADHAGPLAREQLAIALTFAEVATAILLDDESMTPDGTLHPGVERVLGHRSEIYQAQGVVTVVLGVSLAEALARMRGYAYAHDQSLADVAAAIMTDSMEPMSDE